MTEENLASLLEFNFMEETFDNQEVMDAFCSGCPARHKEASTGFSYCPAIDDPFDRDCYRYSNQEAISYVITEAAKEIARLLYE